MECSDKWFVYMIETTCDSLYTGITMDVDARFQKHSTGKGAKFFRMKKPRKVVYTEQYESKELALQREHAIKQLTVTEKRQLFSSK